MTHVTETKEHPILFNGPMVRAIMEGRKTQTRRVVKTQRTSGPHQIDDLVGSPDAIAAFIRHKCPYGVPGGRLWVRETWADVNTEEGPALMYRADNHVIPWRSFCTEFGPDLGSGPSMDYEKYPGNYTMWWSDLQNGEDGHSWRPSIFMPRWACRIMPEVVDVRVERLQEISEGDVKAEGIKHDPECGYQIATGDYRGSLTRSASLAFWALWDSINKKRGFGWDTNPWVWVVEFRKCEPSTK